MARDQTDVHALKMVRSELSKRGFDTTRADVRVLHGVCYIRGLVTAVRGATFKDIAVEMEHVRHLLRQKPEIRDVVLDTQFPGR